MSEDRQVQVLREEIEDLRNRLYAALVVLVSLGFELADFV